MHPSGHELTRMTERRYKVAERYLKGEQQYDLARAFGVTQAQISYDLKAIRGWWRASAIKDFDARQDQELEKVDLLERTAWAAWERSLQPREMTLTEQTEGGEVPDGQGKVRPKSPTRKASVRRENQAGDPRFLEQIQKCIDKRCAILGIGAREEAMKNAGMGLAVLLQEARTQLDAPSPPALPPMAQA